VLKRLIAIKGGCEEMLDILRGSEAYDEALSFAETVSAVKEMGYNVNIDFSVTDDINYYSGIVFKGFVKGIPTSVLSGGRYDKLMKKMGKNAGAIGFAVYLDCFARFDVNDAEYDADALILYDDSCNITSVLKAVESFSGENKKAVTAKSIDEGMRYREIIDLRGEK
jgi:ATP phosphoribosyltransferase regulatory subunit